MSAMHQRTALVLSVCVLALALGGCGGDGATSRPSTPDPIVSVPAPPPPPPPAPPPPPPPPPPSSALADAEYLRSAGSVHGAITAYNAGITGQGVKIAIIDTGVNPALHEFTGRIDPASADVVSNRGVADSEGHGTAVAAVAAANRDGSGVEGVAYGASIIALNTSNPNDCSGTDGCTHSSVDIAKAIDIARQNGARVINISLGGQDASTSVNQAVSRAAAAGIVVVMAAGNDGEKPEGGNPEGFALTAAGVAGNVIIAGSVGVPVNGDPNQGIDYNQISTFSNRAGSGAQYYLAATGYRVIAPDQDGKYFYWSGTSFSTPVVSGAVALLANAFPNLTGSQIIDLLFRTADDAGAAGTDPVFGRGILNITRAFSPVGTLSLPDSKTPVGTINGQTSTPMGDASPKVAGMIALDSYGRAYSLDYQQMLRGAAQERPLGAGLQVGLDTASAGRAGTAVSITVSRNQIGQPQVGFAQLGLTYEDARKARVLSGLAISRLSPGTAVALGISESGKTLQQRLAGAEQGAFLVARDPMTRMGFYGDAAGSLGVRHLLGRVGLTATAERGRVYQPGLNRAIVEPRYSIGSLAMDHRLGPVTLTLTGTRLTEERTVLGASFSDALGGGGSTSWFADAAASLRLAGGWSANAAYRRGTTSLGGAGGIAQGGRLSTEAWSFDVSKSGALFGGDRIALRLMQPLRVRSGGFNLAVPVSYDYATLRAGYDNRFFNLAPTGREIDLEAAYGVRLLGGEFSGNAFARRQPGNIAALRPDLGGAFRFTRGF